MADFSHWNFVDTFNHIEAEALIAGIDPTEIGDSWKKIYPVHRRLEEGFRLAVDSYPGKQPPEALLSTSIQNGESAEKCCTDIASAKFHRKEINRWLCAVGIPSAYEFREIGKNLPPIKSSLVMAQRVPKPDSAAIPATSWPWGYHHTEALGHLEAAALRFWVNYDPADHSTAPTNEMVSDWLQKERGVSKEKAKAIASILRPDGLPTGPRR